MKKFKIGSLIALLLGLVLFTGLIVNADEFTNVFVEVFMIKLSTKTLLTPIFIQKQIGKKMKSLPCDLLMKNTKIMIHQLLMNHG